MKTKIEKLKLKHLAPYLPYQIKVKLNYTVNDYLLGYNKLEKNQIVKLVGYKNKNFYFLHSDNFCAHKKAFELILRPLSDLTKEIEHNREKFVPIIELAKIAYPKDNKFELINNYVDLGIDYTFHIVNKDGNIDFDCRRGFNGKRWDYNCYVPNQLQLFEKLFEWHFDCFKLIENGLAIDKNTLK